MKNSRDLPLSEALKEILNFFMGDIDYSELFVEVALDFIDGDPESIVRIGDTV